MSINAAAHVRLAERRDLDELSILVRESFAQFARALPPHIFEPYVEDASDFSEPWEKAVIGKVEHDGRIAGTVTYYSDAEREGMGWPAGLAGLRTLAVSPLAQGYGYGRTLCEWCLERARQDGAKGVALHTADFMTSACALYESIGFVRQPAHDLLASGVLGVDPKLGDQRILAYLFPLDAEKEVT